MKYSSLALVAVWSISCSGNESLPASPSSFTSSAAVGSERFSVLSEADRAPLGSVGADCASDKPILTQANPNNGKVDFVARFPRGTSKAELEIWVRRDKTGGPANWVKYAGPYEMGDGVQPFTSTYDLVISEEGYYKARVRRVKCGKAVAIGEWSDFKDFTIGSPYDESPVEQPIESVCANPWAVRCTAWED